MTLPKTFVCENCKTTFPNRKYRKHRRFCSLKCFQASTHRESSDSKTPSLEWAAWQGMIDRCRDVKRRPNYAGRGITVCERWQSYENFLADMGRKPSPKHSLDRINNNGNYEPGNCRWATLIQQRANRRPRPIYMKRWKHTASMLEGLT